MKFEAIIFDLDGVICFTDEYHYRAWKTMADSMGMMFLYSAFIREENGKMYVMKRGEDGLLMKQYIEIGKISGEGYEILSGVTTDDYLAFPYGKEVKEGAKTREGTLSDIYSGM